MSFFSHSIAVSRSCTNVAREDQKIVVSQSTVFLGVNQRLSREAISFFVVGLEYIEGVRGIEDFCAGDEVCSDEPVRVADGGGTHSIERLSVVWVKRRELLRRIGDKQSVWSSFQILSQEQNCRVENLYNMVHFHTKPHWENQGSSHKVPATTPLFGGYPLTSHLKPATQ